VLPRSLPRGSHSFVRSSLKNLKFLLQLSLAKAEGEHVGESDCPECEEDCEEIDHAQPPVYELSRVPLPDHWSTTPTSGGKVPSGLVLDHEIEDGKRCC
jgi:hypothetical protein